MRDNLKVDLNNPGDSLETFLRIRADLSGRDTISWFGGTIYIAQPGKAPQPILRSEGFGAVRVAKTGEGAWDLLVREIMVYKDLATGEILSQWQNPFTGRTDDVMHVENDPVNFKLAAGRDFFKWTDLGTDVQVKMEIPLGYPNPLQPAEFPEESSGPLYTGSEHFVFHAKRADIENRALSSVPATTSWFRTGPVLPWMRMGQTSAYLIYSSTGIKYESFDCLSPQIRTYVETHCPKYAKSPEAFIAPNQSSWTVYKERALAKRAAQQTVHSE